MRSLLSNDHHPHALVTTTFAQDSSTPQDAYIGMGEEYFVCNWKLLKHVPSGMQGCMSQTLPYFVQPECQFWLAQAFYVDKRLRSW